MFFLIFLFFSGSELLQLLTPRPRADTFIFFIIFFYRPTHHAHVLTLLLVN